MACMSRIASCTTGDSIGRYSDVLFSNKPARFHARVSWAGERDSKAIHIILSEHQPCHSYILCDTCSAGQCSDELAFVVSDPVRRFHSFIGRRGLVQRLAQKSAAEENVDVRHPCQAAVAVACGKFI